MPADYAHRLTERALSAMEKRISDIYREARDGLDGTVKAYFDAFEKRDREMKKRIGASINGKEWTEEDYRQWRINQIGRGKRFEALRDEMAARYSDANKIALSYVNGEKPGIYAENRNYSAYTIERAGANVSFTLFDENTVRRLIIDEPGLMPYYPPDKALNRGIDLAWGKKQITKTVTSSILQGKSVGGIADDLQSRMEDMNRTSAIRTARTSVTAAQNAGRMDSYAYAKSLGINVKKQWLATLDSRVRHQHAMLDGQAAETDEPFKVDGREIRFPGDPWAAGYLVYNCRCTVIPLLEDLDTSDEQRRTADGVVSDMSYAEWKKLKNSQSVNQDVLNFSGVRDILGAEYCNSMRTVLLSNKNDTAIAIYNAYGDDIRVKDSKFKKTAYFSPSKEGCYFDAAAAAKGDALHLPYQTAYHEFAHNIDYLAGKKLGYPGYLSASYQGGNLETVIKSDFLKFKNSMNCKSNRELFNKLSDEKMQVSERGSLSDILEGCTKVSYPLGVGHGVSYHKRPNATAKEFFAEVLDGMAANQKSLNQLRRAFPNAVNLVEEMVKEAIK